MPRIPEVPTTHNAEVLLLRDRYGSDPSAIVDVLKQLKLSHGTLREELLVEIARAYGVPEHRVIGMASFYSLISTGGSSQKTVRVCDGIACITQGAQNVITHCEQLARESDWTVVKNSCLGLCDLSPAALSGHRQLGRISCEFDHLEELAERSQTPLETLPPKRTGETRFLLRRASEGKTPDSDHDACSYLNSILREKSQSVLDLVEAAQLHGRGGAGYPTAKKWNQVASISADQKYVVCNADESEPLSIKDRTLIDVDPYRLIEGMLLAGYAVGASRGVVYIRGEYEPQARKLERAIAEMYRAGFLGGHLQQTTFSFEVEIHRGAGAYICGEETALLESLEGKRGEPRPRPPYPGQAGLHQCPTIVNNVETLCAVAALCEYGIDVYRQTRIGSSFGTKLYSLFGCVRNPGLFEAPRELTLGELIDHYGEGISEGSAFSFALVGGAAGSFATRSHWDHRVSFSHEADTIPLGTGGILVADESMSVPMALCELLRFFERESCGKCTPCRIGTREARKLLNRLLSGSGQLSDLERLGQLSETLNLSLCGLGTSVPSPIESALKFFRPQFEELITE